MGGRLVTNLIKVGWRHRDVNQLAVRGHDRVGPEILDKILKAAEAVRRVEANEFVRSSVLVDDLYVDVHPQFFSLCVETGRGEGGHV